PYGVSPRGVAVSTTDIYTNAYNGLTNVGVGTKMYFKASWVGQKFVAPTFTMTRRAPGSSSTAAPIGTVKDIINDSTQVVTFTPDKVGVYAITVSEGASTVTVTFNAAKYLGYENAVSGLTCNTCHSENVAEWKHTNHATMFTRAMNGTPGLSGPADHYSASCISCHVTGYDKNTTAVNDGFDDLAFTYPTVLGAGVADQLTVAFPDAMKRGNIQCESCHGPASGHLGVTTDERMVASWDAKVCAWCHDSGTHHFFPDQFAVSKHAVAVDESGPGRESCARCHTGKGFAQYVDGVATTDPYFDASYAPITCVACHDPHAEDNVNQLRKVTATILKYNSATVSAPIATPVTDAGMGTMCINCHQSRTEANQALAGSISNRFGPHHGPQGDLLFSSNMLELGGVKLTSTTHAGAVQDACVRCHMYKVSVVADAQGNIAKVGGHSFGMSHDGYDNMEACAGCHGSTFGTKFADVKFFLYGNGDLDNNGVVQGMQDEVKGMVQKIYDEIKIRKGTITPASSWSTDKVVLSAFWNAKTAEEDKSWGIHNPKYIVTALKGAMQSLGIATAVEQETTVPTDYVVYQNYPNPFNPTTMIRFALPKNGHVKLTIYDALGKEVATLINNELAAGSHNIEWTAKNMASGIYLYRIEAGNFVKVNKMLLVK
ncbi:MAG: T9SS type A sorting domain-containing protein, partial [Melioribacteraceae bacterium]